MAGNSLPGIVGGLILGFSIGVFADPIYKTVDAQGRVTYTSRKPMTEVGPAPRAEQIKVDSGFHNSVLVTRIGSTEYCGGIALPSRNDRDFYSRVAAGRRQWQAAQDRMEADAARFARYGRSSKNSVENIQQLAEYHCANDWAAEQKSQAEKEKIELSRKSQGLSDFLKEKANAEIKLCGKEPIYTGLDRQFEESRKAWRECSSTHRYKLREVEEDLQTTDRQLLDIKKIEETI